MHGQHLFRLVRYLLHMHEYQHMQDRNFQHTLVCWLVPDGQQEVLLEGKSGE